MFPSTDCCIYCSRVSTSRSWWGGRKKRQVPDCTWQINLHLQTSRPPVQPISILSSPLLVLCHPHVWPRTIKCVQQDLLRQWQVPQSTWRSKKFAPPTWCYLDEITFSTGLAYFASTHVTQNPCKVLSRLNAQTSCDDLHDSKMCTFISLPFFSPCPIVWTIPISSLATLYYTSYWGNEWKGLKRCDKHFTVENQVWQASPPFTSVLKIPTKSCGFFSKNTMTGSVPFSSRLLWPNNLGSHRCYHSGSQPRNREYEFVLFLMNI